MTEYACDIRVIRFLRERTLGNSPSCLVRQLWENHSEEWLKRACRYLGACSAFVARPSLLPVTFQDPPQPVAIPTHRWILAVYGRDILSRLDHIKARITSTFGTVLKMYSTKKITKKLSGIAKGTALWLTSVNNEVGQILISVLTAQEGPGLDTMIACLIQRYSSAGVAPPRLLYVNTGCCKEDGETRLKKRFGGWPDLVVKLDIYHFMRRLASGCTNEAHPLYKTFMAKLSCCIFEWNSSDIALLRRAKRKQLKKEGVPGITEKLVDKHITKDELSLHCRRRTRGEQQTIMSIELLFNELKGVKSRDLLGVSLFDWERMEHIWRVQKRHVKCIQDEPGVLLYTETGRTNKGGIILPNYRCARGSTSLESFHCHVNRFIPGTSANSLNFQLYLLEGIHRWNQNREAASLAVKPPSLFSYSEDLVHCANTHSVNMLGKKLVPSFQPPGVYTGELMGIEYLNWQKGQAMQDQDLDAEQTNQMLEDVGSEEESQDEAFEDGGVDPTIELLEFTAPSSVPSPATTTSTCINETPTSPQAAVSTVATTCPCLPATDASSAPPGKQLFVHTAVPSSPSAITTSSTLAPLFSTNLLAPVSSATNADLPGPSDITPTAPEEQLAVDEHCVPGMDLVDSLAEYLVGLRTKRGLTLNNQQASTIIALWQNLLPYDKQRVANAARHQLLCLSHLCGYVLLLQPHSLALNISTTYL
ncbi:uncharacterized protein Hap1MRO34_013056 [Clarias gariepinus]